MVSEGVVMTTMRAVMLLDGFGLNKWMWNVWQLLRCPVASTRTRTIDRACAAEDDSVNVLDKNV